MIEGEIPLPVKFSPWHDRQLVAMTDFALATSSFDINSLGDFTLSSLYTEAYSCVRIYIIPFSGLEAVLPKLAPPRAPGNMMVSYLSEGGTNKPDLAAAILLYHFCFSSSGI